MCRPPILDILESAVNKALTTLAGNVDIPSEGFVIYSKKIGSNRHYFYNQQIRVYPTGEYGIVWLHSSGHQHADAWDSKFHSLEDVAVAFIRNSTSYYQAEADDRSDAAEVYYSALQLEM